MNTKVGWILGLAAVVMSFACATADNSQAGCGDGTCSENESCSTCASDCGSCVDSGAAVNEPADASPVAAWCGDATCDANETCTSCAIDCGSCTPSATCGDSICDVVGGECATCSADCSGICGVCGDGTCDSNEDDLTCAADCALVGGGTCTHSWCDLGGPLALDCDPCVEAVCNLDFYCCLVEWDVSCKNAVSSTCLQNC